MEDLTSRVYPDGPLMALVPTSQAGGNRFSELGPAMTAPGSKSTAGALPDAAQPFPHASFTTDQAGTSTVTDKTGKKSERGTSR